MLTKSLQQSKNLITTFCYLFKTARGSLIEPHELHELIQKKEPLKILQSGFLMPKQQGEPNSVYMKERIPGAQLFQLKEVFTKDTKYSHMLSSVEQFADYMKQKNLKKNETFVIYDDFGITGACRAWWTMKIFGVHNVYILNGSSFKWKNEKLPLEVTAPKQITPAQETEKFELNSSLVVDIDSVKCISNYIQRGFEGFEIIDARSPGRFNGTEPEPRKGLRSGNIPGSKNIFFKDIVNQDWSFKTNQQLKELFELKGIKLDNTRIINSCGSGMTASVLNFAEELLGVNNKAIYDGSWTEFGSVPL